MEALLLPWKLPVSVLGELWPQVTEPRDQERRRKRQKIPGFFAD